MARESIDTLGYVACRTHSHRGTVDAVVPKKDIVHAEVPNCSRDDAASCNTHAIGGTGLLWYNEGPIEDHDSLNSDVHREIRVLAGTAHRN